MDHPDLKSNQLDLSFIIKIINVMCLARRVTFTGLYHIAVEYVVVVGQKRDNMFALYSQVT